MTYLERKLAVPPLCTFKGCASPPLADHLMCRSHRDRHRDRNRRWKQRLLAAMRRLSTC